MPNYNASVQMPQMPMLDAGKTGEQYGGYVGKIAGAISGAVVSEQNKKKIDEYVMAYNNANDTTIFNGLKGALRTEKLARLLLPLDSELSAQYQKKAQAEKADETQIERNMEVVKARESVPTTKANPDIDVEAINAEIALIVDALQSKAQLNAPAAQPEQSITPPVDQSPVIPQANLTAPSPMIGKYMVPPPQGGQPSYIGAMNSAKMVGYNQLQAPTYGRNR